MTADKTKLDTIVVSFAPDAARPGKRRGRPPQHPVDTNATRLEEVTRRLRDLILRGEFASGDRLREESLAEKLDVSRTPVRTALHTLRQEGLVLYEPNRGFSVREFRLDDVLSAYRVREVLEGLACRTLAERGLTKRIENRLVKVLENFGGLCRVESVDMVRRRALMKLNLSFHQTLALGAHNETLSACLARAESLPMTTPRIVPHIASPEFLPGCRKSHAEHLLIFQAIKNRDPDKAEAAMRAHIRRAAEQIMEMVGRSTSLNQIAAPR